MLNKFNVVGYLRNIDVENSRIEVDLTPNEFLKDGFSLGLGVAPEACEKLNQNFNPDNVTIISLDGFIAPDGKGGIALVPTSFSVDVPMAPIKAPIFKMSDDSKNYS